MHIHAKQYKQYVIIYTSIQDNKKQKNIKYNK